MISQAVKVNEFGVLREREREKERGLQKNENFIWSHILMKVSFVASIF
jgi:hypothetical protein